MATPILSKPQQRKSLSAKKTQVKGLKNVLGQPYDTYWPVLENDKDAELENLLRSLLVVLKPNTAKIPWPQLRKMNKEERLAARKALRSNSNNNCEKPTQNSVIIGINIITRSLEKNDVCGVLLDSNIDPALLIKHIVSMALDKNVSILLVPYLKKLTLETMGFASAAIAIKKHVENSPENEFYSLFVKVSELSSELKSLKAPVRLFQEKVLEPVEISDDEKSITEKESVKETVVSPNVYLYRTSKNERIFKPPTSNKDDWKTDTSSSDFIPISSVDSIIDNTKLPSRFFHTVSAESESSNSNKGQYKKRRKFTSESKDGNEFKRKISYKPLKVKRLKGNEFRTKATKPAKLKKNTNV